MEFDARYVDMILLDSEDEHLEFKEAKRNFHFEELVKYCAALANEQGGTIVFGVTDRLPRKVVGTAVFSDLERTKFGLLERLKLRIEATAVIHPQGRVILFRVPSRPIGMPIQYGGAYWMRAGESLTAMTPDMLKRILLGLTQLSTNKVRFGCESAFNCVSPNSFVGKRGVYTRRRGLDHATNKALLRKHIDDSQQSGSRFQEMTQVLPTLTRSQLQRLLRELKDEGYVHTLGKGISAKWYSHPPTRQVHNKQ